MAFGMVWFVGSTVIANIMKTGAFEVFINGTRRAAASVASLPTPLMTTRLRPLFSPPPLSLGELIHSKVQTGQLPQLPAIEQGLAAAGYKL